MKKIFGTINPYHHSFDKKETLGATMASYSFIKALLGSGSFDEFHFFIENRWFVPQFTDFVEKLSLKENIKKKVRLLLLDDLDAALKQNDYSVFHNWDSSIRTVLYARSIYRPASMFPIAAFVHAIAAPLVYEDFVLSLLSATKPYDALICPSNSLKTCMHKYLEEISGYFRSKYGANVRFNGRLEVIPLGVDSKVFTPREKGVLREKLGLPKDKVIAACITRLNPANKMDLFPLIKAFKTALSLSKNKDCVLLIVGKDQFVGYAEDLKKLAGDLSIAGKVIIRTDFDNKDVPLFYSASDFFISPSDNPQETFGLTPIEAMLSGLPVIVSDWNGYSEAVEEGITGFKVPTYWMNCTSKVERDGPVKKLGATLLSLGQSVAIDNNVLAEKIAVLIDNKGAREKMGDAARQHALSKYSWDKIIPRLQELFFELNGIAKQDSIPPDKEQTFLNIPYFSLYKHYPTKLLGVDTKIRSTLTGKSVLEGKEELLLYAFVSGILEAALRDKILHLCPDWTSIEKIAASLPGTDNEALFYNIMHMLKHGLLECKR